MGNVRKICISCFVGYAYGKCCDWHFFQDPEAAAVAPVLLPLLWPYFTANLEHDTRNSYVTLRAFPIRQRLYDAFHRCFTLLPQLDSAEHLHVWPHLAEAMLVVEDILAVLDNPAFV